MTNDIEDKIKPSKQFRKFLLKELQNKYESQNV